MYPLCLRTTTGNQIDGWMDTWFDLKVYSKKKNQKFTLDSFNHLLGRGGGLSCLFQVWSSERLTKMPRITQPANSRADIWTQNICSFLLGDTAGHWVQLSWGFEQVASLSRSQWFGQKPGKQMRLLRGGWGWGASETYVVPGGQVYQQVAGH